MKNMRKGSKLQKILPYAAVLIILSALSQIHNFDIFMDVIIVFAAIMVIKQKIVKKNNAQQLVKTTNVGIPGTTIREMQAVKIARTNNQPRINEFLAERCDCKNWHWTNPWSASEITFTDKHERICTGKVVFMNGSIQKIKCDNRSDIRPNNYIPKKYLVERIDSILEKKEKDLICLANIAKSNGTATLDLKKLDAHVTAREKKIFAERLVKKIGFKSAKVEGLNIILSV